MCDKPDGGYRDVIRLDSIIETVVFTEGVSDPDTESSDLVVGNPDGGNGVKISVIKFNLDELIEKQQENNIWIYQSFIKLIVKDSSTGSDPWKEQVTKLQPLIVNIDNVNTDDGELTSPTNLEDPSGEFTELSQQPTSDRPVVADFTETIQKFISPYNKDKNEDYNGVALVNYFTDGSPEDSTVQEIRYYTFDDITPEDLVPIIDICYKEVPIEECEHPYEPVVTDVVSSVVLVKDGDTLTDETLTHGTDNNDKTYRTVIKFDLEQFVEDSELYDIDESYIHLNYLGPSDESSPTDRTVRVHKILEDWSEDTITFENVVYDDTPVSTLLIEKSRLGGTQVTIAIHNLTREWIENGVTDNFGVILIDADEDGVSSTPLYAQDDSEKNHYKPELKICQKLIQSSTSSSSTTSPSSSSSTSSSSTTSPTSSSSTSSSSTTSPTSSSSTSSSSTTTPSSSSSTSSVSSSSTSSPSTSTSVSSSSSSANIRKQCVPPPEDEGGVRTEFPVTTTTVFMEDPTDEDNLSTDEVVVGKTSGSGIKVTYVTVDYSDILTLQNETHDVWVYESNMFLTVKPSTENKRDFIPQVTEIHPINTPIEDVDKTDLTENPNIEEPTGAFNNINKIPRRDIPTDADFTKTIQQYINPSGSIYNKENNGIVLVNKYTEEGKEPSDDGVSIRYYGVDEEDPQDRPFIDVCYKVVEVKRCEEGEEEVVIVVEDVVTVDKANPDTNYNDEELLVGSPDGTPDSEKRVIIKFNVEQFDSDRYDLSDVTNAWVHLTFNDFTNGDQFNAAPENKIIVTPLTTLPENEDWDESTATWSNTNMDDQPTAPEELGEVIVPQQQPGITPIVVELTGVDIERLINDHKGIVLQGVDEPTSPHSIPEFFGKGEEVFPKPALHVCIPTAPTSTSTASPTQTHTPTFTSASSTSSQPPLLTNCTIPDGGDRIVIDLRQYIEIQDTPTSNINEQFVQIGKTPEKGEKVVLVKFDLERAVREGVIEQLGEPEGQEEWDIAVTDSRINLRLTPDPSDDGDNFEPGQVVMYPLKKPLDEDSSWEYPWIEAGEGPVAGIDYVSTVNAKFNKLHKVPETGRWLQAVTTTIARYIFTELDDYRMPNNGFLLRYVTESGNPATSFITFDSPAFTDPEFTPFMDICYVPFERPTPCPDGKIVYYDLSADTYIAKDGQVHGSEEHLFIGNSGWDGPARSIIDFDIYTFNSELTALHDPDESVYLRLWYEGAEMAKPYNDPRQMERRLAAHKVLKTWSDNHATSKVASVSGNQKNKWDAEMMGELTDYDPEVIASDTISGGEDQHNVWFNITSVFTEWADDKANAHGVVIKDSQHESVPGYFLKFASLNHPDPTVRPYLMVCQKKPICEIEDLPPAPVYDSDGCISTTNVTLNYCVAKNGACTGMEDSASNYGYMTGVSALWDEFHVLRTFCKCCTDAAADRIRVPMSCEGQPKEDYDNYVYYITRCECQKCEEVSSKRKKRAVPSKTRLLLRSALKSMLRK